MSTAADNENRVREAPLRIGSEAHKQLFCRTFLDTYDPYRPAVIPWPALDAASLARLTGLPFWSLAVQAEIRASVYLQAFADQERDPLIREVVELNVFEERRHKEVLDHMLRFYRIETDPEPHIPPPADAELGYLQTGYGECLDSFFSFGLFRLARVSGFFPPDLVEVFDPIVQEEARHILFFVNWAAYTQARRPLWQRPWFAARRAATVAGRIRNRLSYRAIGYGTGKKSESATGTRNDAPRSADAIGIKLAPRAFIDLCLAESERRMAPYDPRLPRPQFLPRLARLARPLLPRG